MKNSEIIGKFKNVIVRSPLFSGMDDGTLCGALDILNGKAAEYARGDFLHSAFTAMDRFGLVLRGNVQACADDIEGNRMIMADVQSGCTFGESLCFLKIEDSPVYIYAPESCTVLWLETGKLYKSQEPVVSELQRRFTAVLAARTLVMNGRIQILSKLKLRDKLITYFSELSSSSGSNTFNIPFNREDMAAYIGTERSALSRELSAMKKEGIIDYYKNTFRLLKL